MDKHLVFFHDFQWEPGTCCSNTVFLNVWFTTRELSPLPFPSISPVATTVWQIREIKDACPDLFESKGSSGL